MSTVRNTVIFHSCENMTEVKDQSARLVIMSPPFADGSEGPTLDKTRYLEFIGSVLTETYRLLAPNGTLISINTDLRDHTRYNRGCRRHEGSVWFKHSDLRAQAENAGFKCIDCKIWAKSLKANVYRYNFAYIMFFCKQGCRPFRSGPRKRSRLFKADVWLLQGGTQRVDSMGFRFRNAIHPEIVERCIDEFTVAGDLVVSPFTGSGTIPAVAQLMARNWIGYEVDTSLRLLINESIYGPNRPSIYKIILARHPPSRDTCSLKRHESPVGV